jgi:predicted transcriptional regulator
MTPILSNSHKNTAFNLSEQVKATLHEKGYSFLFNYSDYKYFKEKAKQAFNKAQAITELFIQENQTEENDFSEYVF